MKIQSYIPFYFDPSEHPNLKATFFFMLTLGAVAGATLYKEFDDQSNTDFETTASITSAITVISLSMVLLCCVCYAPVKIYEVLDRKENQNHNLDSDKYEFSTCDIRYSCFPFTSFKAGAWSMTLLSVVSIGVLSLANGGLQNSWNELINSETLDLLKPLMFTLFSAISCALTGMGMHSLLFNVCHRKTGAPIELDDTGPFLRPRILSDAYHKWEDLEQAQNTEKEFSIEIEHRSWGRST